MTLLEQQMIDELVVAQGFTNDLAANLNTQGVAASNTEGLDTLVPKVLTISSGGDVYHNDILDRNGDPNFLHINEEEKALITSTAGIVSEHTEAIEDLEENKADTLHTHTKSEVGLPNVDNTSDANKPISTATQTALNSKADKATTLSGYGITDAVTQTNILYANLLALINNNQLIPSSSYRITDYNTTTAQADTISAGHDFDVIVTALSTNELSEDASCVRKDGDTYFENAKLEAWEIKYCIDNDTNRFAWADATSGKGVIYYMKDEWGNECPYDFKNIQFKRYPIISMPNGSTDLVFDVDNQKIKYALKDSYNTIYPSGAVIDENNASYYFTFNAILQDSETYDIYDASIIQNGIKNDEGGDFVVQNNKINEAHTSLDTTYGYGQILKLNDVVINNVIDSLQYTEMSYGCYSNTFGNTFYFNTFGNNCNSNTFGNNCYSNTFGNGCHSNTFGNGCHSNTFGDFCSSNTFGSGCSSNTFDNQCYSNTFGNAYRNNKFGTNCYSNTFGNDCRSNTFGDFCNYSTFGDLCYSNTFGGYCTNNTFGNTFYFNTFGNYCNYNTFGNNCYYNTFGDSCNSNTFGNTFYSNTFGNYCNYNTFGDFCYSNKFYHGSSGTTKKDYIRYVVLEDGVSNNNFYSDVTTSGESYLQRIRIKGLENTSTTDIQINTTANNKFELVVAKNSSGIIKQYCPEDLVP